MRGGAAKARLGSHFVGSVLENPRVPRDEHGTAGLVEGHSIVPYYRTPKTETRVLVAV